MHRLSTSFVLGYHGCSATTADLVVSGKSFKISENPYDWLGNGVYFWEANPARGLEFYRQTQRRKGLSADDATVVGAVIDLGLCLDLASSGGVEAVQAAYRELKAVSAKAGVDLPTNSRDDDSLLRNLDCAVINFLHESRKTQSLATFDTVRGVFFEGGQAFEGSGFRERTHIQLAVNNLASIRGVFRVPAADLLA